MVISIKYQPDDEPARQLRVLFCSESKRKGNPLTETNFNDLLAKLAQSAFDDGMRFSQENPSLKVP